MEICILKMIYILLQYGKGTILLPHTVHKCVVRCGCGQSKMMWGGVRCGAMQIFLMNCDVRCGIRNF